MVRGDQRLLSEFLLLQSYLIHLTGFRETEIVTSETPDWHAGVFDTAVSTLRGGRLLRLKNELESSAFMATYGDGVGSVEIHKLVEFHCSRDVLATLTVVRPLEPFLRRFPAGAQYCMIGTK